MKELAFELPEGGVWRLSGRRIDDDVAFAAIDDDRIPRFDILQYARHAAYGRDAAAAGDNRRVARLAPRLRDDGADVDVSQRNGLRRQQFVGNHDQRTGEHLRIGLEHIGQVRTEPQHDVTNIVKPLFQVFVLGARKERRVFVHQAMQSGRSGLPFVDNPRPHFFGERLIADNRFMHSKDSASIRPYLPGDFLRA